MPVCDGPQCNREVPWRITNTALQMRAGNVSFSVDTIHRNLIAELTAAKCWNLAPPKRPVVFKNLCTVCWMKQAATWGDAKTYADARARTVPEAVCMQVMRPDFQVNAVFSKEAILSCAVHELMHYWSFNAVGLQAYNRHNGGPDWDEAIADLLGFRVYKRAYSSEPGFSNYMTPYNTYCKCFDRAKTGFGQNFTRRYGDDAAIKRFPKPVCEAVGRAKQLKQTAKEAMGPSADCLAKTMCEYFFTWFFLGPQTPISEGGSSVVRIDAFLDSENLRNMFAVSNAFQSYQGNNTLHAI